jgi:type IV pilus assembly protein PilB
MKFDDVTIKNILLKGNYITQEDIDLGEKYAEEHRGSFIEYLISEGIVNEDIIGQALAEEFGVSYSNLKVNMPDKEQVLMIPEDIARESRVVLFSKNKNEYVFATDNPKNEKLPGQLESLFPNKKIKITFTLPDDLDEIFINYQQGLETKFSKLLESKGRVAPEIVDQILEDAFLLKASDVHFEPQEREVVIRFRVDGVLHEAGKMPKEYYDNIVNRIKVQAKLRIDEHFSSQDGAIHFVSKSYPQPVDLRVSIVPTLDGEKVAIRILSSYVRDLTLSDIGLSDELNEQIVKSAKKPFGMILVTGPTGSGKSTTLYALIKMINTKEKNITTIEDPVEYKVQGVNQIQANTQTNLSFAKGLRAIMRQDPNVILVGEIRDLETADIAVNAALTGHLLLSTFHSNNSATAIPRFVDMGIEPFLISSTLELIISQRLVRRICDSCKVSYSISKEEISEISSAASEHFSGKSVTLYKGKGCNICSHTGYKGRIGVFEFIKSSSELQDLMSKNPSTKDVEELVKKQGFKSMFEDGLEKVKSGITTLDEVVRVINS